MRGKNFLTGLVLALGLLVAGSTAVADPPGLDLDLELDPDSRAFRAVAVATPHTREFLFLLHESLKVTGATAGGESLPVAIVGQDGPLRRWRVVVPALGETVRIGYEGILPPLNQDLDHRGVLGGLPPMAAPAGSFLPAGGAWYPRPASFFTYRVRVSVPGTQRAVVPGRLESEETPADGRGRYRATFQFVQPADGIDLMAGPWVVRERTMLRGESEPVRLRTYFTSDLDTTPGLAEGYLADSERYLARYSRQIGPYPFTEFSVVAGPLPTGFGMPTLTYMGTAVLRLPFIRATSLGHEVLHNWWGNGVYVDYAQGNWSEGLTTFMADYAYKEDESAEAAREMRLGWLRDFAAVPEDGHQPLASFRSRTHGAAAAVGYGKSAMVFVMLRDLIGNGAFQEGLRSFWARNRFKVAGWDDLRTAFENASGHPLGAFFDQWLNRAGAPQVAVEDVTARPVGNHTLLSVNFKQSYPPYSLRLPIAVEYSNRTETRWLDLASRQAQSSLEVAGLPLGVRLDPDLRLWRRLGPEQLPPILRQWILSPSPQLVLATDAPDFTDAARSLAQRLFERPPSLSARDTLARASGPVLLIGRHADVDAALADAGLPPPPPSLAGRGSAQVWTIQRKSDTSIAVVSARDTEALIALQRPLPHYGSQSWLVFDGSRAVDKGVWPAPGPLLPVRLRD